MANNTLKIWIKKKTFQKLDELRDKFNTPSRSDIVRRALELQYTLIKAIENGDKIYIEGENNRRREIHIPGIN